MLTRPTLLDIAILNGADSAAGLIEEVMQAHPEIAAGHWRTIRGLNYRTKVRTSVPTVPFRDANEGTAVVKSTYANRLVETYICNPYWECDKAVADASEEGPEAFIATEAAGILEGAMQTLAKCFYYGRHETLGDAKAFPGLIDSYDAADRVVDAEGTTPNTGTSVWLVKWGIDSVAWVLGQGGELAVSDPRIETIRDDAGNPLTGYVQDLLMRPGLQVANRTKVVRIKKLTADAGCTLDDDILAEALSKFPAGIVPDVMLMTRRSREQLRKSRTATNATGAPAPIPSDAYGVPIAVTDAIADTEPLTL
ncbi:MAG: hypothetical protein GX547_16195 [Phycisphaerae bacterium]|nr:hypothetical protein [Phycisphaerae bacterium]